MKNSPFPAAHGLNFEMAWAQRHEKEPGWVNSVPVVGAASLWLLERGSLFVESDGSAAQEIKAPI